MALYKVISNYYTDILDTINVVYMDNGKNFNVAFDKLDKLSLVKKLAYMSNKLQRVQDSDMNYWKAQQKTFIFYMVTLSLILVAVFIGVFNFFLYKVKDIKDDPSVYYKRPTEIAKAFFLYLTIFLGVFTAFFLLLINLKFAINRAKAQQEKNIEDFKRFRDLLFGSSSGSYVMIFLNYIGLIEKGHTEQAHQLFKTLENEVKKLEKNKKDNTNNIVDINQLKNYVSSMSMLNATTINNACTFNQLLSDLKENLRNFFADGKGYANLKVQVVSSSNILTLREIKRVMNYYYFLTLKKSTDQNIELSEKNKQKLLNQIVIKPIVTITISKLMTDQRTYLDTINQIAQLLVPYEIDLSKHAKFIMDGIIAETQDINKEKTDFINDLFKRLYREIFIKQQTSFKNIIGNSNTNESRFYSPDDFIDNMNDMVYTDFNEGLELEYLRTVTNMFYNRISAAKDSNTLDDIKYNGMKSHKLYLYFVILFIIVVCLGLFYYLLSWFDDFQVVLFANSQRETTESTKLEKIYNGEQLSEAKIKLKYEVKKANMQYIVNSIIKLVIPVVCVFFFVSLVYAYSQKQYEVFKYNQDIIEENTSAFMSGINAVYMKLGSLDGQINQPLKRVSELSQISDQDKFELFRLMKDMIDRFEKCNYIMEAAKNKLPFPYAEVATDIFMIVALIGGLVYVTTSFKPGSKATDILKLRKQRGEVALGIITFDDSIKKELDDDYICHDNEVEIIVFTLKVIFFLLVFIFLLFYSMKVLSSSTEFGTGIYNSAYFDENRCYGYE